MAAAVNALSFPVIRHVLAIVDDVEGGQAVAGIAGNFFGGPSAYGRLEPKPKGARGGAPKPQRNKAASACARASCAMGSSPDGRDPPIPLAGSAGLGSGRGSRARMLATRSAGERSLIGVGVVCRMEYRAGHAWEHDGAPLSGQRRSARYRRLLSVTEIFDQEKRAGGGQMARSPPCSGALQAL